MPDFTKHNRLRERAIVEEIVSYAKMLPIKEKIMIFMRYRDGYTFSQIACAFGISESTVRRRIVKINKKLCAAKAKDSVVEKIPLVAV